MIQNPGIFLSIAPDVGIIRTVMHCIILITGTCRGWAVVLSCHGSHASCRVGGPAGPGRVRTRPPSTVWAASLAGCAEHEPACHVQDAGGWRSQSLRLAGSRRAVLAGGWHLQVCGGGGPAAGAAADEHGRDLQVGLAHMVPQGIWRRGGVEGVWGGKGRQGVGPAAWRGSRGVRATPLPDESAAPTPCHSTSRGAACPRPLLGPCAILCPPTAHRADWRWSGVC